MLVAGSEKTRTGYSSAGAPYTDLPVAGFTRAFQRIATTEKPTAQEVVVDFGTVSAVKQIWMTPYIPIDSSTFNSSPVLLDEKITKTAEVSNSDYTLNDLSIVIESSSSKGFSTTVTNGHKGWLIRNTSLSQSAYVTSSSYDSFNNRLTLNFLESISRSDPTPTAWTAAHGYIFQRWFHNDSSIDPSYQTYPSVTVREGEFRISGGKASGAANKPIWAGYINRAFFPSHAKTFTYQGTYASERKIAAPSLAMDRAQTSIGGTLVALETGYTYWLGICAVYDGYQYSPIQAISAGAYYASVSGQYLDGTVYIPAHLNKRITGYIIFMAQDKGDTSSSGRVNPFYLVKEISLSDTALTFGFDTATQTFTYNLDIDKTVWDNRTSEWSSLSGYTEGVATIHSYDQEINALGRQFITRVYNDTAAQDDLDRVYTNPTSGDGVVQPDIFPLEPDVFVGRAQWGDSSYITGLVETERGRIIVLKDRAVIDLGVEIDNDGTCRFRPLIVSTQDGCVSPNTGFIKTPYGIYFAGYNDFYVLDGLQLKPLARDDWGDTYTALSTANKQSSIMWYRDDEKAIFWLCGTSGFVFYLSTKDWRQFEYAHTLTSLTTKRDGTVVWLATSTAYAFDTSTTDAGTGIKAKWKTGDMMLTPSGTVGVFVEAFVNKSVVSSSGTLECNVKRTIDGTTTTTTLSGLTKSDTRLLLPLGIDENRRFDFLSLEYNQNASGETGAVSFEDIEVKFAADFKTKVA